MSESYSPALWKKFFERYYDDELHDFHTKFQNLDEHKSNPEGRGFVINFQHLLYLWGSLGEKMDSLIDYFTRNPASALQDANRALQEYILPKPEHPDWNKVRVEIKGFGPETVGGILNAENKHAAAPSFHRDCIVPRPLCRDMRLNS